MEPRIRKIDLIYESLKELVIPQNCACCEKPFTNANTLKDRMLQAYYGLCACCMEQLQIPLAQRNRCTVCGQPLVSEIETCLPCRNGQKRFFDQLICLFPYNGKYRKILTAFKFKKRLNLGNYYIKMLFQGLDEINTLLQGKFDKKTTLIPIPPRPGKIKKNGWDQIVYLTKLLVKSGIAYPVNNCLIRLSTPSQKGLTKNERLVNLKGKIILNKKTAAGRNTAPNTAILFDDVYTTGSTMDACAEVLKSAGAQKVYGICLLYD